MKNDLPDFRANPNGYFRLGRSVENPNVMESESDKVRAGESASAGSGKSLVGGKSDSDKPLSIAERLLAIKAYHQGIVDSIAGLDKKATSILSKHSAVHKMVAKHEEFIRALTEVSTAFEPEDFSAGNFEQLVGRTKRLPLGRYDDNGKRL